MTGNYVDATIRTMNRDGTPAVALSTTPAERLVDAIALPIGRWDRDGRLLFCNEPYCRWACRPRDELVGRSLQELYGDDAWAIARGRFAEAFEGRTVHYERRLTHLGAGARWTRAMVFPDRNVDGEVEAIFTIAFDIHDDVVEREALHAARKQVDRFTEHIPYPLTYVDRDCVLRFVNRAYVQAVGVSAAELVGQHIGQVRGATLWAQHQPFFERALAGEAAHFTRLVDYLPVGARWLRTSYVPDFGDDGQVQGIYTVTIDVHELTEAQQRLQRSVERDGLTDALTRRTMMERLDAAVTTCSSQPVALFFVDLDGFKALNDARGHAAGDAILIAVAGALHGAVRVEDAVGRFGGDEFLVLAGVRDSAGAHTLAGHLLQAVRDCAAQVAGTLPLSASIGYALAPNDATQPLRLLQLADSAMYAAKRSGRDQVLHCASGA
jgi:diguanylate cyclase (GGDEF)-like protein/PAS domain S-box-containing protein